MDRVLACLIQDHDALIIGLAALVCAAGCAAFVALATQSKAYASPAGRRLRNLVDALVLAHTVWTTHFVAMVGYRPAVSGSYEIGQTIASYLLVFVASVIAILLFEKATLKNRVAAGVAFCVGLAGMHYVGMASVTFPLLVEWDPGMGSRGRSPRAYFWSSQFPACTSPAWRRLHS
jgi:NO-binding membrane sensor protein with MHYT domain